MRILKRDGIRSLDESAQLLLIAGFAVGVGIVVLTIMLNNVIYASNIASESSIDTSRYDIANAIQMTTEAYEDAYKAATESGSINNTTFENQLQSYEIMASKNFAISGFTFNFDNNTRYEPYFTQNGLASGRDNWTIISNVNTTDMFLLEINDNTLENSSNSLLITATNNTGLLWSVEIYNSSGTIQINVSNATAILNTDSFPASGISSFNITGDVSTFQFQSYTEGNNYSINVIGGSNSAGWCTFSGNLTNGEDYRFARLWVVNPTITMHSYEMEIARTLPISLPGRVI
ncbi:hypothetical protein [Methanolobus sp.]|uniref:hypothetical protein n=1 Tax=Methanolobus sp. TaxID=1874737 RepID=UPI0025E28308|nr:hypothetical protein [Methanolobus sp.]